MSPRGESYFGLMPALRQRELLDEAREAHGAASRTSVRRGRLINLLIPQLRRDR
jgi:hypothetical protein